MIEGSGKLIAVTAGAVMSAAALWTFGWNCDKYARLCRLLGQYKQNCSMSPTSAMALHQEFVGQMVAGLSGQPNTTLLMLPSFIKQMPTGDESGEYLAVDFGGTSIRLLHVVLSETRSVVEKQSTDEMQIPLDVLQGESRGVYSFIARQIIRFARAQHIDLSTPDSGTASGLPPIGFCFSFPMKQTAIDRGSLVRWTKGFECKDGVGACPVKELTAAIFRVGYTSNVVALLNDSVGVIGAARYSQPETAVGLVLGTGTNACYVEKQANVACMAPDINASPKKDAKYLETLINTEWGAFSCAFVPILREDRDLDAASNWPGEQQFEKLVSGFYIGEITRRILLSCVKKCEILLPSEYGRLDTEYSLTTKALAEIHEDDSYGQAKCSAALMNAFGIRKQACSYMFCWLAKQVAELVVGRAAELIAVGLVAILGKMEAMRRRGNYCIAADGSVYTKYTKYRELIQKNTKFFVQHHLHYSVLVKTDSGKEFEEVHDEFEQGVKARSPFSIEFVNCVGGCCMGSAVIAAAAVSER